MTPRTPTKNTASDGDSTLQELPNGQIILNLPKPIALVMRYNKGDTLRFEIERETLALYKGNDQPPALTCPHCKSTNVTYYDGSIGYEAIRCHNCHIESDLNSDNHNPFDCTCNTKEPTPVTTTKGANTSIIQQLPNGQLTINIPRAIAQALKYKKGDTITFDMRDFTLILHKD